MAPVVQTQKAVGKATEVNGSKQQASVTIIENAGEEDEVEVLGENEEEFGKVADEEGTGAIKVDIGCNNGLRLEKLALLQNQQAIVTLGEAVCEEVVNPPNG